MRAFAAVHRNDNVWAVIREARHYGRVRSAIRDMMDDGVRRADLAIVRGTVAERETLIARLPA